jgi:hypothetical protein
MMSKLPSMRVQKIAHFDVHQLQSSASMLLIEHDLPINTVEDTQFGKKISGYSRCINAIRNGFYRPIKLSLYIFRR